MNLPDRARLAAEILEENRAWITSVVSNAIAMAMLGEASETDALMSLVVVGIMRGREQAGAASKISDEVAAIVGAAQKR